MPSITLRLDGQWKATSSQYDPPATLEIFGLYVGDFTKFDRQRALIIEHRSEGFKRISDMHPSFIAMQHPIWFLYGEDGYQLRIT